MQKWIDSILEAVGCTPLLRLSRLTPRGSADIFAKVEGLNPGGSIKTRTALGMIEAAEREGKLKPGSIIVEVSSGNQGIAMAMIGAIKGYRVKILMPETMSAERQKLMQAYGAEVILTPAGGNIGEAMEIALAMSRRMAEEDPRVFLPRQFENGNNPDIHRRTTAREILAQIDRPVDAFVAGFGTGGTITGVGEVLKEAFPAIKIYAAEPENAAVLAGGKVGQHIQMGIGDGFIPPVLNREIIDGTISISDKCAVATSQALARREGVLCGVSSGTNVGAALILAKRLGPGKTVVTVLPDTGERYLSAGIY